MLLQLLPPLQSPGLMFAALPGTRRVAGVLVGQDLGAWGLGSEGTSSRPQW